MVQVQRQNILHKMKITFYYETHNRACSLVYGKLVHSWIPFTPVPTDSPQYASVVHYAATLGLTIRDLPVVTITDNTGHILRIFSGSFDINELKSLL